MGSVIPARRLATLVGTVSSPAFSGLASALARLIADGRLPLAAKLPSERELAGALGLSRTTITRAYSALVEAGYAVARQGAGTFTQVPGGIRRGRDHGLLPRPSGADLIDLTCAACDAVPGLASAYAEAAAELPAYLRGHGYFPLGVPDLRAAIAADYAARGAPTDPEQILVTSGTIGAIAAVAAALVGTGDRVLVESPAYPNSVTAFRRAGGRLVSAAVDPSGWDLDDLTATLRQAHPKLAYLIPDFQNPTGLLMSDDQRAAVAAELAATRTIGMVDECHYALRLDDAPAPLAFAAHSPGTISVGGASKLFWGGLRIGWIRAPKPLLARLTQARLGLDLGAPLLEQLVVARLLTDTDAAGQQRDRLRANRDLLAGLLGDLLPDWRFRLPSGGLSLWVELTRPAAAALAVEAERRGLVITPGSVFSPDGGLSSFVRLPYTLGADELTRAAHILAESWAALDDLAGTPDPVRILIA